MGPTVAYISHLNLRHNVNLIRNAVGKRKIMAVVKANAYGHGDIEVSKTVIKAGCEYLGVAFVEEGIRLRKAGIDTPILVFGSHAPEFLQGAIDHNLEFTITNLQQIEFLRTRASDKLALIHVKFDTGMNRVGFPFAEYQDVLTLLLNLPGVKVCGVYSHLATSDEADPAFTITQIQRFKEIHTFISHLNQSDILCHIANSGAIMQHPEAYYDMVRPGIMLYGQPPSPDFELEWDLHEVMTLQTHLGLIKLIEKNEPISYGRRYYTKDKSYIAVIPAGYADGISRADTNNADVIIKKKRYPMVGTVCMDMIMIDLGPENIHAEGDTVTIYGAGISISEVARRRKTIPYEVTCNVSPRVPRVHTYQ